MKTLVLYALNFFDFFYKKKLLTHLKKVMKGNDNIFFDVGAHRGETVKMIVNNFNAKEIFAFEPLKSNFNRLKKNTSSIKKNKNIKVQYFNFALGVKKERKNIKEMIETSSSTFNPIDTKSKYFKRKVFLLGGVFKKNIYKEREVLVEKAKDVVIKCNIKKIDLLKIDTEGFEFNVIKGFQKELKKVRVILFEHHYDLMIKKDYKYHDINNYLLNNNFKLLFKFKMPFRKTFEYLYFNEIIK